MKPTCEPKRVQVLTFEPCMDTVACAEVEPRLRELLEAADASIIFDLAEVEFVSSAFLRLCFFAQHQAGKNGFQIINVQPMVKRVFKIAGVENVLHIR